MTHPTPHPDVNAVLHEFCAGVQAILGDQFIGMYLHGSLALGDFNPQRSDIDFLVVTADEIGDETRDALAAMHARLATSDSLVKELEGSYILVTAVRRYDPARARHPYHERHGRLRVEHHESDWVIHRHVLRRHGVTLAGPAPMLQDPTRLKDPWYQAYGVLTMCRILHTLQQGIVVSKPVAARWAQEALGEPRTGLIERALARGVAEPFDHLNDTLAFIRYTLDRSRRFAPLRSA